jgi:hypothetical protein
LRAKALAHAIHHGSKCRRRGVRTSMGRFRPGAAGSRRGRVHSPGGSIIGRHGKMPSWRGLFPHWTRWSFRWTL